MPNWCYNSMTVKGPKADLERFIKAVTLPEKDEAKTSNGNDAGVFDFALLYPTPEPLKITDRLWGAEFYDKATPEERAELDALIAQYESNIKTYGYKTWYDWNCANWGTKWSPRVESLELDQYPHLEDSYYIQSYFETAWCPAAGLLAKISEQFPTLIFEVTSDEESEAFVVHEIFYQGQVFEAGFDPYKTDELPDGLRERIIAKQAELEATDFSDDNWSELRVELSDLYNELKDKAEEEASRIFLAKFPNAYA